MPINRRAFITRTAAGTLALAVAPRAFGQNPANPESAPAAAAAPAPPSAPPPRPALPFRSDHKLADIRMRDACILAEPEKKTYTLVASAWRGGVRAFTSRDLIAWEGPHGIYQTPEGFWPGCAMRGIWAPELHRYRGKYYLFLTFDTTTPLAEQWRDWLPRVRRGSQVLVGDSALGPFTPFAARPTLPEDMMTLDGTLWEEDGVPYMIFCHEWVQVVNGNISLVPLTPDLSAMAGEPKRLFWGNDAPWGKRSDQHGCWVTDGPWLHRSKSGKLFMIWSSGSATGYAIGTAISDSGKLAGPWRQDPVALYDSDGGHGMIFMRFDGQLMLALHSPNKAQERIRLFEMEDTGETLRVLHPFPSA